MDPIPSLPGPRTPAVVQFAQWIWRPIAYLEACHRRYGDTFALRFPFYPPIALVSHPHAIREVFTDSEDALVAGEANAVFAPVLGSASVLVVDGPTHQQTRRVLLDALGHQSGRNDTIAALTSSILETLPGDRAVPLLRTTQSLTLDLLLHGLLGIRTGPFAMELRRQLSALLGVFEDPAAMMTLWACQRDLGPLTPWRKVRRRVAAVRRLLGMELEESRRRGTPETPLDILATRAADTDALPESAIVDQLMTLLISGHETLAPTLAWALSWLGRRRDLADALRARSRGPHADLLDAFTKECLRLTPVIITVGRRLQRPMTIAGIALPAGTVVAPCVYLTHRHRDVWREPVTFRPERFLERRVTAHEFYPFGGGIRHCLGADFAVTCLRTLVAGMVTRFGHIEVSGPETPTRRGTSIVPSPRVAMTVTARA